MLGISAGRPRHRGVRYRAAPFVLAMLCLRAFIPAGFMLAPIDGRLEIVLCDTDAGGSGHSTGLHATHHGHHSDPAHPHAHPDPTCPYAQSSGPAPLPALPAVAAVRVTVLTGRSVEVAQTDSHFGPERQHTSRGPPQLT
jgi:hypothetical protein